MAQLHRNKKNMLKGTSGRFHVDQIADSYKLYYIIVV